MVANEQPFHAGEQFGKQIDVLGKEASRMVGVSAQSKPVLGMSWVELLIRLVLVAFIILLERLLRLVLGRYDRALAARGDRDETVTFIGALSRPLSLFIIFFGGYGALFPLIKYSAFFHEAASRGADVVAAFCIAWFFYRNIGVIEGRLTLRAEKTRSELDDALIPLLGRIMRILIFIGGLVRIVHSLTGLDVGPMMASLGIGGIAVALAAKDSLANFIGSMTILFDRPFTMGVRILIDGHEGIVGEVGFRCTRIRWPVIRSPSPTKRWSTPRW